MSTIEIKDTKVETYSNLGRYFYADMSNGKHSLAVAIKPHGVQVVVCNASHRAWRRMGKEFPTMDAALAYYRTDAIRAMLTRAAELNKAAA